jgi:hypothetical protein
MFSRTYSAALAVVLAGVLVAALAAPAVAADPRVPLDNPTQTLSGYCQGFDVFVEFTNYNQYIIRQQTAPDGTTTLRIAGSARATVTNLETGKSVSFNVSGPGTVVIYPVDPKTKMSAFSIDGAGPNLLWTLPKNSFPGVPTISYTTGHVTLFVNSAGLTTQYSLAGGSRQTDVCALLR